LLPTVFPAATRFATAAVARLSMSPVFCAGF
jgi:hypothetical protein